MPTAALNGSYNYWMVALSLFIALYHALNERAYDIAVLRTLGAHRANIAMMVMLEALMLAILGSALGLLLAHGLVAILAWWMVQQESLPINAWTFSAKELWLLLPSLLAMRPNEPLLSLRSWPCALRS